MARYWRPPSRAPERCKAPPFARGEAAKSLTRPLWSGMPGCRMARGETACDLRGPPWRSAAGRVAGGRRRGVLRPGAAVRPWCHDWQCRHRSGHCRCDGARDIWHGVPGRPARDVARCRSDCPESGLSSPAKAAAAGARVSGSWATGRAVRSPGSGVLAAGAAHAAPIAGFNLHHAKGSTSGYRGGGASHNPASSSRHGPDHARLVGAGAPFTAACTRSFVPRLAWSSAPCRRAGGTAVSACSGLHRSA